MGNSQKAETKKESQEDALERYDKALSINPNDAKTYFNKGVTLSALGRKEAAIDCYDKALSIDPNNPKCYLNKGSALSTLDSKEAALVCYDKALSINPNYATAYFNKGRTLSALGQREAAIDCYDRALSIDPNDVKTYFNKGVVLSALGRKEAAIECFDKALSIRPNDAQAYFNKGNALSALGQKDVAIDCYDKALSINSNDAAVYFNKGNALDDLGRREAAIECYDRSLSIDPNDPATYYNKGVALSALGWKEAAIECYDRVISVTPNDGDAYYNKGSALSALGRKEAAIECYNRALSINPNDTLAHCNKGSALLDLNREKEALVCFNTAYNLMKSTVQGTELSKGNLKFIQRTLDEDREKLLLKLRDLEESIIATEDSLKDLDLELPAVRVAVERMKTLRTERKEIVSELVVVIDTKTTSIDPNDLRLLFEKMQEMQNEVNSLRRHINVLETTVQIHEITLQDHEARLKKAEEEIKTLNLTQDGMKAVMSSIESQLQAHESRITLTEGECVRLGEELNQSVENVKGLTSRLYDLGLRQTDLQGVVSVLKSQMGSHEDKLNFNEREIEEWSQQLKITNDEAKKLTESLEKMALRVDEEGKSTLLEELRDRVMSNEIAIGEMLHRVGIQDLEIDSLTKQMQEDGVTRGELLELFPVVNTLKTVIENQIPPSPVSGILASPAASNQRIEDPYKRSLYQTLVRELNATYLATCCVQTKIVKNNLSGGMGKLGKILSSVGGSIPMIGGGVQFLGMVLSEVDSLRQTEFVKRYSGVAVSASEMDEISRGISLKLLDDSFDKSVLHRPESLLNQIFKGVLGLGEAVLEGAGGGKEGLIEVAMSGASEQVAEQVVEKESRFFSLFKRKKTKGPSQSAEDEVNLSKSEPQEKRVEDDQYELGESHGKVLASLIISKIFAGEVSSKGCAESGEFVDQVVVVTYAHFQLAPPVLVKAEVKVNEGRGVSANALKVLSEEIAQGITSQLQTVDAKELARVLRTCHLKLLEKAIECEDLKVDLIEELTRELEEVTAGNNFSSSGGKFREMVESCVRRALGC